MADPASTVDLGRVVEIVLSALAGGGGGHLASKVGKFSHTRLEGRLSRLTDRFEAHLKVAEPMMADYAQRMAHYAMMAGQLDDLKGELVAIKASLDALTRTLYTLVGEVRGRPAGGGGR